MTKTYQKQNLQVAKIIAEQIGNRAFTMMGTNRLVAIDKGLQFNVRGLRGRNNINQIVIRLNGLDYYDIEFNHYSKKTFSTNLVNGVDNISVDVLHKIIEEYTGLYLSL